MPANHALSESDSPSSVAVKEEDNDCGHTRGCNAFIKQRHHVSAVCDRS